MNEAAATITPPPPPLPAPLLPPLPTPLLLLALPALYPTTDTLGLDVDNEVTTIVGVARDWSGPVTPRMGAWSTTVLSIDIFDLLTIVGGVGGGVGGGGGVDGGGDGDVGGGGGGGGVVVNGVDGVVGGGGGSVDFVARGDAAEEECMGLRTLQFAWVVMVTGVVALECSVVMVVVAVAVDESPAPATTATELFITQLLLLSLKDCFEVIM